MADPKKNSSTSRVGDAIRENQAKKELQHAQKDKEVRLQLAKQGRKAYEEKNTIEAIAIYLKFLELTSRSLNVDIPSLHPKLFPEKDRASEGLLISSICFDLAKLYDQVDNAGKERATYLRLVVMFSQNMKFQKMMSDNLQKFVAYTSSVRHPDEFKAAALALQKDKRCFIATAAFDSSQAHEVQILRDFRDAYLVGSPIGRWLTESYYFISPPVAEVISKNALLRSLVRFSLKVLIVFLPNNGSKAI